MKQKKGTWQLPAPLFNKYRVRFKSVCLRMLYTTIFSGSISMSFQYNQMNLEQYFYMVNICNNGQAMSRKSSSFEF